jgi:hypothetical protein
MAKKEVKNCICSSAECYFLLTGDFSCCSPFYTQLCHKYFCTDESEAGPSQPLGKRKGPPQEELYSEDEEDTESDLGSIPAMTPFSNLLSMD